jgi:hypothetical protein
MTLTISLINFGAWWSSQPYGLTSLPSWLIHGCISPSISILKWLSGIYVILDKSSFWRKKITYAQTVRALPAGRPQHLDAPRTITVQISELLLRTIKGENTTVPDQAQTIRPYGADHPPVENQKKPEGVGFNKNDLYRPRDRPGCTAKPSMTALSDIWQRI